MLVNVKVTSSNQSELHPPPFWSHAIDFSIKWNDILFFFEQELKLPPTGASRCPQFHGNLFAQCVALILQVEQPPWTWTLLSVLYSPVHTSGSWNSQLRPDDPSDPMTRVTSAFSPISVDMVLSRSTQTEEETRARGTSRVQIPQVWHFLLSFETRAM